MFSPILFSSGAIIFAALAAHAPVAAGAGFFGFLAAHLTASCLIWASPSTPAATEHSPSPMHAQAHLEYGLVTFPAFLLGTFVVWYHQEGLGSGEPVGIAGMGWLNLGQGSNHLLKNLGSLLGMSVLRLVELLVYLWQQSNFGKRTYKWMVLQLRVASPCIFGLMLERGPTSFIRAEKYFHGAASEENSPKLETRDKFGMPESCSLASLTWR